MLKQAAISTVDAVLSNPVLFGLQQRLCNDYTPIREAFAPVIARPGVKILDIGCSVGTCAGQVVDMKTADYTGIDIDANYVRKAAERYPDGRFLAMDASKMSFPDQHFDVCMFICVLHHMSNEAVQSCLGDIKRVLKSGGRILVAEPVFTKGWPLSSLFLHLDRGRHIRDESGYRALFQGFTLKQESHVKVSLHRIHLMQLEQAA